MQLQFKRVYVDLILAGKKTQTLRATMPAGARPDAPVTFLNGYRQGATFAHSTLIAVDTVLARDLSERDARMDGFASLADLRDVLAQTYPDATTLYRLRWVSPVQAVAGHRAAASTDRGTRTTHRSGRP